MDQNLAKEHLKELNRLLNKEEQRLYSGPCTEHCPKCNTKCRLHEPGNNLDAVDFIQSLVPEGTDIHRCHHGHQWLTGKYGVIVIDEPGTNVNFVEEVRNKVQIEQAKIITVPGPTLTTGTTTSVPYGYYTTNWLPTEEAEETEAEETEKQALPPPKEEIKITKYSVDETYSEKQDRDITLEE